MVACVGSSRAPELTTPQLVGPTTYNSERMGATRLETTPTPEAVPMEVAFASISSGNSPVVGLGCLGQWKITSDDVADEWKLGNNPDMTMSVYMANCEPAKCRQLWATFKFGPEIQGYFRLCPPPEERRPAKTVAAFEKQCILKKGVWPGDSLSAPGKSYQKCGHRWRGEVIGKGKFKSIDQFENMLEFKREEDGTLKFSGVLQISWGPIYLWSGVEVADAKEPNASDPVLTTLWNKYRTGV
jgi:hypothetical protein